MTIEREKSVHPDPAAVRNFVARQFPDATPWQLDYVQALYSARANDRKIAAISAPRRYGLGHVVQMSESLRGMLDTFYQPPRAAPPWAPSYVCTLVPGRVAILPTLTTHQTWLVQRAVDVALHGRSRLWDADWRPIAELHAVRTSSGCTVTACAGEGCPWCARATDPSPERLPAFPTWTNPYFPPQFRAYRMSAYTLESLHSLRWRHWK